MNLRNFFFITCGAAVLAGCGASSTSQLKEEWDNRNDPVHFSLSLEYELASLPTEGEAEKQAWADTYWPSYRGGLAQRWQNPNDDSFTYESPTLEQLRGMTAEEIGLLSPAEKYDIFIGNYDYDFVGYERSRTSPDDEGWFGLCHGWAPAAINFDEPLPVELEGANGIVVPFGSSDVKALLTFFQQYYRHPSDTRFLGGRCDIDIGDDPDAGELPQCRDINAGTFHVIIANLLGLQSKGFVADVTRDLQVWNQPIDSFTSQIIGESDEVYERAAPGTVKIVTVETRMGYTVETYPQWNTTGAEEPDYPYNRYADYRYTLELGESGEVLGGEWQTSRRPDFMWQQTAPEFGGYFAALEGIYRAATVRQ